MTQGYEQHIGMPAIIAPEEIRVAEFQAVLSKVAVQPLITTPDISLPEPTVAAKQEFICHELQPSPAFYALPEIAHELEEDLVGFEPYVSRAGKASRHGVFFGGLVFGDGFELGIAVKPHFANPGDSVSLREAQTSCLNDYFTNVAAKKAGFEGLAPVGMILDQQGTPYSLTVLDEKLQSLDSINWTRFFEPGFETIGMRELLRKLAYVTANVHNTGDSFLGDMALRNTATNVYGHVFLFDWEDGKVTTVPAPDVEEHFGSTWKDIKGLMLSMVKPARNHDPGADMFARCEGSWWEAFKEVFMDDYVEARLTLARQGSHHMPKLRDTEAELTQLQYVLQLEIERWEQRAKTRTSLDNHH